MTSATLFRKTAKGTEAIASRLHGPGPRLRPTLILVDGKRDLEELGRLSGMGSETARVIEQLVQDGFVEPVPEEAPAPRARPAPTRPPAGPSPAQALLEGQRLAARRLTALLGPNAESLCIRIEATRSAADLAAAVTRAAAMLQEFRGATIAAAFIAEMQENGISVG